MNKKTSGISLSISLILLLGCLIALTILILLTVSGTLGPLASLMGFIIGLNQRQIPRFTLEIMGSLAIIGLVVYTIYSLNKK